MDDVKKGAEKWKDMSENDRCKIMAAECDGLEIETVKKSLLNVRTWQKKTEPKGMFNPDRYYRIAMFEKQSDADHVLSDDEKVLTVGNKVFDAIPADGCDDCHFQSFHTDMDCHACPYTRTCHNNKRKDGLSVIWKLREAPYELSEDGYVLTVDNVRYAHVVESGCANCDLFRFRSTCPYEKLCTTSKHRNGSNTIWKKIDTYELQEEHIEKINDGLKPKEQESKAYELSDDQMTLMVDGKKYQAKYENYCSDCCMYRSTRANITECRYFGTCMKSYRLDGRTIVWKPYEDKHDNKYSLSEDGMTLMVDGKKYEAEAGWTCVACSLYAHLPVLQCPYVKTCLHHSKSNTKSVVWKLCDNESAGLVPWDCASDVPDNIWLKSRYSKDEYAVIARNNECLHVASTNIQYEQLFNNGWIYRVSGTTEWKRCGKVGTTANMP